MPTRSYPICISIHPPRAGRDPRTPPRTLTTNYFNPPAPCGAGLIQNVNGLFIPLFQSTRPVRGGTKSIIRRACSSSISIHPPHAGRDYAGTADCHVIGISIHPPHAGRDRQRPWRESGCRISIHPPRAGRDCQRQLENSGLDNFNPPAPCGAGQPTQTFTEISEDISIHPPRAGRDTNNLPCVCHFIISIHPPRAGRDPVPPLHQTP